MSNRIAIVDQNRCKPQKCKRECIANCPPQSGGKEVITIVDIEDIRPTANKEIQCKKKIAKIIEKQCIGCNICVKKCPFHAIRIVNLPFENKAEIIHRYTLNGFRLYRLPQLKKNMVTGIIGENGIGKSTLIQILSHQITPNFERFEESFTTKQIMSHFRGSVSYEYLKSLYSNELRIAIKPQRPASIPSIPLHEFLSTMREDLLQRLDLSPLLDTPVNRLSGGELQRVMCYQTLSTDADAYFFDEPSNYLDIKQRLEMVKLIRELVHPDKYIIVIDHDMSMVDVMADEIVILYGKPSAYGIVSQPMTTLEGINVYMDGYIPSENVRFRSEEFNLKPAVELIDQEQKEEKNMVPYEGGTIVYPESHFTLTIPSDRIRLHGSIHVIMGENGNGKSTFLTYIAKTLDVPISHKSQTLSIKKYEKDGTYPTVSELFYNKIHHAYTDPRFFKEVVKPLEMEELLDRPLNQLSGGELQRVLTIVCLGTPASIYMIDEPSANLDIEKRMTMIKVLKRFILNHNKCAFIIEHDMMMAVAFAQEYTSRILTIGKELKDDQRMCSLSPYMTFQEGITSFLKSLDITMRISSHNRPRLNKMDSQLDKEQKAANTYYV